MNQKKFYKIIGCNNGNFPYKLGMNVLADNGEEFNKNPKCGPGGLYFCKIENIFDWLEFGDKVCVLSVPEDARMVSVENQFKADRIFIEKIISIDIKSLAEAGADVRANDDLALLMAVKNGNLEVVKFLVGAGANVHACYDEALRLAAEKGHLEIIKYLVAAGADPHARNDFSLCWAYYYGHLDVVEYLQSLGPK